MTEQNNQVESRDNAIQNQTKNNAAGKQQQDDAMQVLKGAIEDKDPNAEDC